SRSVSRGGADAGEGCEASTHGNRFAAARGVQSFAAFDAPCQRGVGKHICYSWPMRIGVFTPLLSQFPLEKVFEKLRTLNISTVELGTGNYPGDPHCKLSMLDSKAELNEFKQKLADNGFSISALSCHGNPLHPNTAIAKAYQETSKRTVRLAEKLGVPVVIDFSGCPGDSDKAKYPNWVTCPWPPEYLDVLAWQWERKVIPYWTRHAQFAKDHGVKIAIEMHPGFVVYSPETLLKLRP